jgi:phosphoglycolate phosphatase-like HAD superfamily hydrolase
MDYTAAIFDLDGTLVHSTPEYRYQIVGATLRDLGRVFRKQHVDRFWFEARRDEIIKECFGVDPKTFWRVYKKYDITATRKKFTKPYLDVGFICELKQNSIKLGIATGAPHHILDFELELLGKNNFETAITTHASKIIKAKPHPQSIEMCLDALSVTQDQAMYVGNADEDFQAAKNAGVLDVLVMRGEYDFQNINPSLRISSLYELRPLFGIKEQ